MEEKQTNPITETSASEQVIQQPAVEVNKNFNISDNKIALSICGLIVLLGAFLLGSFAAEKHNAPKVAEHIFNPFEGMEIEAKSAIVIDVRNDKVLYAKDELSLRPLASITKLMTALAASKSIKKDSIITITNKDIRAEGDSGLRVGEKISFQKLIDFTLTGSSNDGASALASAVTAATSAEFSKTMNVLAREIGLKGLLFENSTGLDGDGINAGAYGSAQDVAKLLSYIVQTNPGLISATRYQNISMQSDGGLTHSTKNTNDALPFIPGLIGGKTGYTELSQGNLAVAFDPGLGHPYVVVVLGSSQDGRFEDVKKLVGATLSLNQKK